ncbi:hypothetical protein [Thioclava kandeliae]|uniref:Uncharacterized protein n=1 Tax=Thioclava kandeliae TaxID=3070818 RepID=A0ABV1SCS2_9RHOB
MTEAVVLERRDGPWGWDAAGARYLCADGGEAGAPDPEMMAFLQSRLAALSAPQVAVHDDRIVLVFDTSDTAGRARDALAGHLILLAECEENRLPVRPGAGFSRQNAALLVEMLSEVMLDLSPSAPMW